MAATSTAAPSQGSQIYGGPPGLSVGRYQPSLLSPPQADISAPSGVPLPQALPGRDVPVFPQKDRGMIQPPPKDEVGPENGIRIGEAVDTLIRNNLELKVRSSDISQADSDVITANLHNNPILYADTQGVPYGAYSRDSTGGPTQFDINIVYPLDLSHKRQARTKAAVVARDFVVASYRDAIRLTVDNLYKAYVDALVAQWNYDAAIGKRPDDALSAVQVDEPAAALWDAQRALALILNVPAAEISRRQLRARLEYERSDERLYPTNELVQKALENRPDLAAQRLAVVLADANVKAVMANRFDDVLLLYQPFTLKDGVPFGDPNRLAWALGITLPLPIHNRQQGNLLKAREIAQQARTKLASLEQAVASEVQGAVIEHQAAHQAYVRTWNDLQRTRREHSTVSASKRMKLDDPLRGDIQQLEEQIKLLRADTELDKLKSYYEAIVRHRRSLLRFNTVIGTTCMYY
jgi:cobalt-zinc-cadmium efflux system outer membrane protein